MDTTGMIALCAAVATASAAVGGVATAWWNNKRTLRKDEVDVLQAIIDKLQTRIVAIETDMAAVQASREAERLKHQSDILALKDEHTACLLIQEQLRTRIAVLETKVNHEQENPVG